ncbi:MAG: MYXO-CTERM sorting domain-containing protein [Myxococcota bacterium]
MWIQLLLSLSSALGAPPDAQVETLSSGSSSMTGGSVDQQGDVFAFVAGSQVVVVDAATWEVTTSSPCTVRSAAVVDRATNDEVWVGCSNGELRPMVLIDGDPLAVSDPDNDDADWVLESSDADPLEDEVVALFYAQSELGGPFIYAIYDTAGNARAVQFDTDSGDAAAPALLSFEGFESGSVGPRVLFISHGSNRMTSLNWVTNGALPQLSAFGIDVSDVEAVGGAIDSAFTVQRGSSGFVASYLHAQAGFNTTVLTSTPNIQAVGVSQDLDDEWMLAVFNDRVEVLELTNGVLASAEPADTFDLDGTVQDVVVGPSGYTLAGMSGGEIAVLTDRPWVSNLSVTIDGQPVTEVGEGDEVEVEFDIDQAGEWSIELGGQWQTQGSGTVLEGPQAASTAGTITATLDGSMWQEGSNLLKVYLDNGDAVGHIGTRLLVDLAPNRVPLSESNVTYEDKTLTLTFDALDSADIAKYTVYVTTTPFTAAEYPTGGPKFDGDDELDAPIEVTEFTAKQSISVEITPLTNNKTYYLAVRATDSGGQEGAMSAVIDEEPRPTRTASQISGETGGMDCSTSGSAAGWPLALMGLLGLAGWRRRRWLGAAAVVGAVALALPVSSVAQDDPAPPVDDYPADEDEDEDEDDDWNDRFDYDDGNGDLTPAWGNVEIRYGMYRGTDKGIEAVFGAGHEAAFSEDPNKQKTSTASALMIEFGPQIYRFVEIDFGIGLIPRNGFTLDDNNQPSGTPAQLFIVPTSASITPRLHIFDEQPVVPFVSLGADWWLFRERKGGGENANKTFLTGSKFGWHYEAGVNVLLDLFDRRRASLLEAQSGINDSWITLSYRRQIIESSGDAADDGTKEGFTFTGDTFQVGLKLDF